MPLGIITDEIVEKNIRPFLYCKNKPLKKCTPEFPAGWQLPSCKSVTADGERILVNNSFLICKYGGQVTIDLPDPAKNADAPNVFDKLKEKVNGIYNDVKKKLGLEDEKAKPEDKQKDDDKTDEEDGKDKPEDTQDENDKKNEEDENTKSEDKENDSLKDKFDDVVEDLKELKNKFDEIKKDPIAEIGKTLRGENKLGELLDDYVHPAIMNSADSLYDYFKDFEDADKLTTDAIVDATKTDYEIRLEEEEKLKNENPNNPNNNKPKSDKPNEKVNTKPKNNNKYKSTGFIQDKIRKELEKHGTYKKYKKELDVVEALITSGGDFMGVIQNEVNKKLDKNGANKILNKELGASTTFASTGEEYDALIKDVKNTLLAIIKEKYPEEYAKVMAAINKVTDAIKKINKNLSLASNVYNGVKFLASGLPVGLVVVCGSAGGGKGDGGDGSGGKSGNGADDGKGNGDGTDDDEPQILKVYVEDKDKRELTVDEIDVGTEVYLVIKANKAANGKLADIDLGQSTNDYEYIDDYSCGVSEEGVFKGIIINGGDGEEDSLTRILFKAVLAQ